jgi:proteasome lid subunit RPN8/RPN11
LNRDVIAIGQNKNIPFMREVSCLALPHFGVIDISTFNMHSLVGFNIDMFTDFFQQNKEVIKQNNVLYMIHSHPDGITSPSTIDEEMVLGWKYSFGIHIAYIIVEKNTLYFDVLYKKNRWSIPEEKFLECKDLDDLTKYIYGLSKIDINPSQITIDNIQLKDYSWLYV